jgi:hypothetical protein
LTPTQYSLTGSDFVRKQNYLFDATLRFALLASLRSAIFCEILGGQQIGHFSRKR